MPEFAPKVTVVIAAYAPGAGLDRVFASLDAQTMPQEDFEVLVVDDGSPDDTLERLAAFATTRPNLRFWSIPNTGWASGPRNRAIAEARGEYLLFMDHDDALYPDALRRSYEFASEHGSDVLSAKEAKSNSVSWGTENFLENIPNAVPDPGISALLPMVPHKFYRRQLLIDHDIRFPEGRRILWEDIYFNVAAYAHANVVSVLADTPVYQWVITGENNSSTYGPKSEEFWQRLIDLMEFIDETLSEPRLAATRRTMLMQQYRVRVLGRFHPLLALADEPAMPMAMGFVRQILERWIPAEWDVDLESMDRARSALLRQDRPDLLRALHQDQTAVPGRSTLDELEWVDGVLRLTTTARWRTEGGAPLVLDDRDGRYFRRLPAAVAAALPDAMLDITDDVLGSTSRITVTSRETKVTWALPTTVTARVEAVPGGGVTPVVTAVAELDPQTAAWDRPLEGTSWNVHARNTFGGATNHRALGSVQAAKPAIVGGRTVDAYANTRKALSIDLGQQLRSALTDSRGFGADGSSGPLSGFSVAVLGIPVVGDADIPVTAVLQPLGSGIRRMLLSKRFRRVPVLGTAMPPLLGKVDGQLGRLEGALVARDGAVRFVGSGAARPGWYRLGFVVGSGTTSTSNHGVRVSGGTIRFDATKSD